MDITMTEAKKTNEHKNLIDPNKKRPLPNVLNQLQVMLVGVFATFTYDQLYTEFIASGGDGIRRWLEDIKRRIHSWMESHHPDDLSLDEYDTWLEETSKNSLSEMPMWVDTLHAQLGKDMEEGEIDEHAALRDVAKKWTLETGRIVDRASKRKHWGSSHSAQQALEDKEEECHMVVHALKKAQQLITSQEALLANQAEEINELKEQLQNAIAKSLVEQGANT